jgi:hypothetical protein
LPIDNFLSSTQQLPSGKKKERRSRTPAEKAYLNLESKKGKSEEKPPVLSLFFLTGGSGSGSRIQEL